jgi:hypothetical protein
VPITLTGTNFTSDYYPDAQPEIAIYLDGRTGEDMATVRGITVENFVVVNSTTITCDFVISQTAPIGLGGRVAVSHTGGISSYAGAPTFTVGFPSDFLVFFG